MVVGIFMIFYYLIVDSINDILMAIFFEEVDVDRQKR